MCQVTDDVEKTMVSILQVNIRHYILSQKKRIPVDEVQNCDLKICQRIVMLKNRNGFHFVTQI